MVRYLVMRWIAFSFVAGAIACGSRSELRLSASVARGGSAGTGAVGATGGASGGSGGSGAAGGAFGGAGGVAGSAGVAGTGAAPARCGFAEVALGGNHTCARTAAGQAYCWGANDFGQVGDGTAGFDRTTPTVVAAPADVVALGAGEFHSHALRRAGGGLGWGHNPFGNLGNGSNFDAEAPVSISILAGGSRISRGPAAGYHACAVHAGGKLSCWGDNQKGQLGGGNTQGSTTPKSVAGVSDGRDVVAGYIHTCAVHHDGSVSCFGWNANGVIGIGTAGGETIALPSKVPGISDAEQVVAGNHYACARRRTGSVLCWGYNGHGQLGIGETKQEQVLVPTPVQGLADAVFLAGGRSHACAVRASGQVVCWGRNYFGQVGDGTTVDRGVPFEVTGLTDASSVAAGGDHSCAFSASRGLVCWGANGSGQLGDGTSQDRLSPVEVACPISTCGETDVALAASRFTSCGDGQRVGQIGSVAGITCRDVCCAFGFTGCSHRAAQSDFKACLDPSPAVAGSCDDVYFESWSSECVCEP